VQPLFSDATEPLTTVPKYPRYINFEDPCQCRRQNTGHQSASESFGFPIRSSYATTCHIVYFRLRLGFSTKQSISHVPLGHWLLHSWASSRNVIRVTTHHNGSAISKSRNFARVLVVMPVAADLVGQQPTTPGFWGTRDAAIPHKKQANDNCCKPNPARAREEGFSTRSGLLTPLLRESMQPHAHIFDWLLGISWFGLAGTGWMV